MHSVFRGGFAGAVVAGGGGEGEEGNLCGRHGVVGDTGGGDEKAVGDAEGDVSGCPLIDAGCVHEAGGGDDESAGGGVGGPGGDSFRGDGRVAWDGCVAESCPDNYCKGSDCNIFIKSEVIE